MTAPLRIAMFVGAFPVASETFILRQITGLLELGHDVRIFANARGDDVAHEAIARHCLLERTTFVDGPPASITWEMPLRPVSGQTWLPGEANATPNLALVADVMSVAARCAAVAPAITRSVLDAREYGFRARSGSGVYRLATLLRERGEFDVLHAHFGPVGNCFRFARDLFRAPLVVSFHGYDCSSVPRESGAAVYERLFADAAAVTGNSDFMGAKLRELGCRASRIHKLPYGIEAADFPFQERTLAAGEPLRILTIGRLVEKKGLEFTLEAVARVRASLPHLRYDIIGEGPLRKRLEQLIQRLGLRGVVTLHGAQAVEEVQRQLARAHLFVLASVTAADGDQEGTPVSLMEAQATGLPVVSTRHAGIPEIVADGRSGHLVPERDVEALAARLGELAAHPERWPEMGRAGSRRIAEEFDLGRLTQRLVDIYGAMLAAGRPGRNAERSTA